MADKFRHGWTYSAWELGGDWAWVGTYYAVPVGGISRYEQCDIGPNQGCCFSRVKAGRRGIATIKRYFAPDALFNLVQIAPLNEGE